MILSICLVLIAVFLTGISQVFLKIGSRRGKEKDRFFAAYLNSITLTAYGLLIVVTVISVIALREIPLKVFYAIASLNFVIVPGLSWKLLGETMNKKQIFATFLIIIGIIVFNF